MRKKAFFAVAVVFGLPSVCFAAPSFNYSEAQSIIPVSSTDLVNTGQPSYLSYTATGFTPFTDSSGTSSPAVLNDGSGGTYGVSAVQTTVTTQTTSWTLTYNLAGSATGYNVTGVNVASLWNKDFVDQDYQVAFAPVTNLTNFTAYATEIANETTGVSGEDIESYLTDTTGTLAKNVGAIQFTFYPDSTDTYQHLAAYTEVDVLGAASPAPEPAALGAVAAAGMIGLLRRRRRA